MRPSDPDTCRRALHEIREIAAVAALENSRMTEQEALQAMSAIADWVEETAPGARADCGDVIRRISDLTARTDLEALDDRSALDLFARVLEALLGDRSADTAGPGGERTGEGPGAARSASGG
ncbi:MULTISPECIES: hypothetical protein [unclassified Brevundimonas]|uniref:hypothetical protein n=1 Tax=unclassified Brevundimonas TaxID=2622653 RepID=UPI001FD7A022|nr:MULTISPECIES: hypothetical protein [unclassified Brevundimonas]